MSVQRRVNWISQQRIDLPDVRSIESAVSNDFDQLVQAFVTGTNQGYVLRGFTIAMTGAIGGAASGLLMEVDPGAVFHTKGSQSGTVLMVPTGTLPQQLNSATNAIVDGAFTPNAINYVGIDYERYIDSSTSAQVYLWDPTTNAETTKTAPRAQILRYRIKITTSTWASNVLPIAIVQTDAGNNVQSITNARDPLFGLGTGGTAPNPFYVYPWTAQSEGRNPNSPTSSSNSINPFHGGDNMLGTFKDWMNAIMTSIKEIKGTTYWSSLGSAGSISSLREDLGNTVVTGQGSISHGILPNAFPVLSTTGDITNNSNQILNLASVAGIVPGQFIYGTGIPFHNTVVSVGGSTVTMLYPATQTIVGSGVSFYDADVFTNPGQVNWDQNIYLNVIGSRLKYKILANQSNNYITLSDNQVAYINLIRGVAIAPNLIFTNASAIVTSVGSVSWTSSLQSGDWVKLSADDNSQYYQILSVDSLTQVTLTETFQGSSTGITGAKAVYAYGTYQAVASPSGNDRAIQIANRQSVPSGQDIWWLFVRSDNSGSIPRVYVKFIGQELESGETSQIDDGVSKQTLQYIGAPLESSSLPMYASALNPNSIAQITSITTPAASAMTSGQYFWLYSSGSQRTYYVWVKKDGVGTDPWPALNSIGLEWDVTTGQTSTQTAASLVSILNTTYFGDFHATSVGATVTVLNNSAGTTTSAVNFNVSSLSISVSQTGTGIGNYSFQDGDNLTLAIKKLDNTVAAIVLGAIQPGYDETVDIVASGEVPPTSLNGPITIGTNISLPNNSRLGNTPVHYAVGHAKLDVFLNGQKLIVDIDYTEVGSTGAPSTQIQIQQGLVVGDVLQFKFGGGGGGGGGGQQGPPGAIGPQGPAGNDAVGGPVAISTKNANYTVTSFDNVLLADCSGGDVTFTLPTPASSVGKVWFFKKVDSSANNMFLVVTGGANIDGSPSFSTNTQWASLMVVTDGSQFYIF